MTLCPHTHSGPMQAFNSNQTDKKNAVVVRDANAIRNIYHVAGIKVLARQS